MIQYVPDQQSAVDHERYCLHPSPIGDLLLAMTQNAVTAIWFPENQRPDPAQLELSQHACFSALRLQLDQYFDGTLENFELALRPRGSAFQHRVWRALLDIPFGATCSYASVANAVGSPRATRAVGHANGRNPIPLLIPCHRVIGSNGSLTGFGGGLPIKRYLLQLECPQQQSIDFAR